jgi:hypothetical protein
MVEMQRRRLQKVSAFAGERKPKRRRVDAPFLLKPYDNTAFANRHRLDNVLYCVESGSGGYDKQRRRPIYYCFVNKVLMGKV